MKQDQNTLTFCGYHKTDDMPRDFVDFSTNKKSSQNSVLKSLLNIVQGKNISLFDSLIQKGLTVSQAKELTANEEKLKRFYTYTSSERDENGKLLSGLSRPLTNDEAITFIDLSIAYGNEELFIELKDAEKDEHYSNIVEEIIKDEKLLTRYINLTKHNDFFGFKRLLTSYEAIQVVKNELSDEQIEKFLELTDDEIDKNGELKSGLKTLIDVPTAIQFVALGVTTPVQINAYYEILKTKDRNKNINHLSALAIVQNEKKLELYSLLRDEEKNEVGRYKSGLTCILSPSNIIKVVQTFGGKNHNFLSFVDLINKGCDYTAAFQICSNNNKLNMFNTLISDKKDENGLLKSGLEKPLNYIEAQNVVQNDIPNEQIPLFLDILSSGACLYDAREIATDENMRELLEYYTCDKKDINGHLVSGLTRPLSKKEAVDVISNGINFEQISYFIELIDNGLNLDNEQIIDIITNNVEKSQIPRFIKFIGDEEDINGNLKSGLAQYLESYEIIMLIDEGFSDEEIIRYSQLIRSTDYSNFLNQIEENEAINFVKKGLDDEQIFRYFSIIESGIFSASENFKPQRNELEKYEDSIIEIAKDKEKYKRYKFLCSDKCNAKTRKLLNGYKRALSYYEAVQFTTPTIANDEQIRFYLDLEPNDKNYHEIIEIAKNSSNFERYQLLTNEKNISSPISATIVKHNIPDEAINTFIQLLEKNQNKSASKIAEFIKNNITTQSQIDLYNELEETIGEITALKIVADKEKSKQFLSLIMPKIDKMDYDRALTKDEAIDFVIPDILDNSIVKEYLKMTKNGKYIDIAKSIIKDKNKTQHYFDLINDDFLTQEAMFITAFSIPDEKIPLYKKLIESNIKPEVAAILTNNFYNLQNVTSINELSLEERKSLLQTLVKHNTNLFLPNLQSDIFKILPKDKTQYCQLLSNLANSIGITTNLLDENKKQTFFTGLEELNKTIKTADIENLEISLEFSRDEFISQVEKILDKIDQNERRKICDYFGFDIKNSELIGYPQIPNNTDKLDEIKNNETQNIIQNLILIVEKFTSNNKIKIDKNKQLEKNLNKVLEGLPEFKTSIGKIQHDTHDFTLDKHMLMVLKNIVNHPNFEKLSKNDKQTLTIVALLHDITKKENTIDKTHPTESAFDAYYIIQKLNLSEDEQLKIYQLIKTHNWLEVINSSKNKNEKENLTKSFAFNMRHANTFELSKILCEADLKSVKINNLFWHAYNTNFKTISRNIEICLRQLNRNKIILPQTRIPKVSELNNTTIKIADDITNNIIYINEADEDLSKYGFEKGTTKSNWKSLVHAIENQEQLEKLNTFSIVDSDALISTSYISPKEYKTYQKQGLILDVHPSDIHVGYFRDFGTGFGKKLNLLLEDYLFPTSRLYIYRNFIPQLIKSKLGINNEKYEQYMKKLENCKSITNIEKIDKEFAQTFEQVFLEMNVEKKKYGSKYNEMLISRPKIQGIFSNGQKFEDIPIFLRKFAQDNDLPIIIFG